MINEILPPACENCVHLNIKDFYFGFCDVGLRGQVEPADFCSRYKAKQRTAHVELDDVLEALCGRCPHSHDCGRWCELYATVCDKWEEKGEHDDND